MTTFKADDIVVCVDQGCGRFLVKGQEYVVTDIVQKNGDPFIKVNGSNASYFPRRFSRVPPDVTRQGAAEYEDAIKSIEIFDKIK